MFDSQNSTSSSTIIYQYAVLSWETPSEKFGSTGYRAGGYTHCCLKLCFDALDSIEIQKNYAEFYARTQFPVAYWMRWKIIIGRSNIRIVASDFILFKTCSSWFHHKAEKLVVVCKRSEVIVSRSLQSFLCGWELVIFQKTCFFGEEHRLLSYLTHQNFEWESVIGIFSFPRFTMCNLVKDWVALCRNLKRYDCLRYKRISIPFFNWRFVWLTNGFAFRCIKFKSIN